MGYLIFGIILLILSIFLGIEISKTHNAVMIIFDHWVIETSLWVAILGAIVLFIVLYALFRLIGKALGISKQLQHWKKSRRDRKARTLTHDGLCELAEGNWENAEEKLLKAARNNRHPLIDYLAAAKAAQAQFAFDRRDNYLRRAHQHDTEATIAIGLTQAQLQIESKQWEQALATLQHLRQKAPKHGFILKLLAQVYVQLNEWAQCQQLLHPLKKSKSITKKEYAQLENKVYLALLSESSHKALETLESTWKSLPKECSQQPEFIFTYTKGLLNWKQDETAGHAIATYLKRHWDSNLAQLFGLIRYPSASKQLDTAEKWFQKHPCDSKLLLTLGELCLREKLWGKAEEYLQKSIDTHPSTEGYIKLGNLYEATNNEEKAQACYQEVITLANKPTCH